MQLDSLHVPQIRMEQLVYQDIIYKLNGQHVLYVHHQHKLVHQLPHFNHVYQDIMQLQ